jgi:GNAT superfamily N-acetyltransferase
MRYAAACHDRFEEDSLPIEIFSPRWQDDVVRLADEILGEGFLATPSEVAREPNALFLVNREKDETLAGFAFGQLWPSGELGQLLEPLGIEIPADLVEADEAGTLGVIQGVAVAPGHRKRGIATSLLHVLHDRLVGLGADKLIVIFKRGPSASPVDNVMAKIAFEPWISIPAYWRERCDAGEFGCVDRRDGCGCVALIYRKAVY